MDASHLNRYHGNLTTRTKLYQYSKSRRSLQEKNNKTKIVKTHTSVFTHVDTCFGLCCVDHWFLQCMVETFCNISLHLIIISKYSYNIF